jgi:hypothetical protein
MVWGYGCGNDHGADTRQVGWVVPLPDLGAEGHQVGRARRVGIAARDGDSAPAGNERQSAHPRTGDSHEMDRARVGGVKQGHV